MEKNELERINQTVLALLRSPHLEKYNIPEGVEGFLELSCQNYSDLIDKFENGKIKIQVPLPLDSFVFSIVASRKESIAMNIAALVPYLITLLIVIFSIYFSNYWLLIGIPLVFASSFFSSPLVNPPLYPFKGGILLWFSLFISILFLFFGKSEIAILSISYFLCHLASSKVRKIYVRTLGRRAVELDSVFRFLYTGKYIKIIKTNNLNAAS